MFEKQGAHQQQTKPTSFNNLIEFKTNDQISNNPQNSPYLKLKQFECSIGIIYLSTNTQQPHRHSRSLTFIVVKSNEQHKQGQMRRQIISNYYKSIQRAAIAAMVKVLNSSFEESLDDSSSEEMYDIFEEEEDNQDGKVVEADSSSQLSDISDDRQCGVKDQIKQEHTVIQEQPAAKTNNNKQMSIKQYLDAIHPPKLTGIKFQNITRHNNTRRNPQQHQQVGQPFGQKVSSTPFLGQKQQPPTKKLEHTAKMKGIRKQQCRFQGDWICPLKTCRRIYTIKSNLINHVRKEHLYKTQKILKKIRTPLKLEKIVVYTKKFMEFCYKDAKLEQ